VRVHPRSRRARDERGAAAVEFALIVPLLLLVMLVIVDFGRILFVQIGVASASREVARASAVGLLAATPGLTLEQVAAGAAPGTVGLAALDDKAAFVVTATACSPTVPYDETTATVSVTFKWITPIGLVRTFDSDSPNRSTSVLTSKTRMLCLI
jgi:Flp pilus assembly protein TadG